MEVADNGLHCRLVSRDSWAAPLRGTPDHLYHRLPGRNGSLPSILNSSGRRQSYGQLSWFPLWVRPSEEPPTTFTTRSRPARQVCHRSWAVLVNNLNSGCLGSHFGSGPSKNPRPPLSRGPWSAHQSAIDPGLFPSTPFLRPAVWFSLWQLRLFRNVRHRSVPLQDALDPRQQYSGSITMLQPRHVFAIPKITTDRNTRRGRFWLF